MILIDLEDLWVEDVEEDEAVGEQAKRATGV